MVPSVAYLVAVISVLVGIVLVGVGTSAVDNEIRAIYTTIDASMWDTILLLDNVSSAHGCSKSCRNIKKNLTGKCSIDQRIQ